jgi:hypothetical protein
MYILTSVITAQIKVTGGSGTANPTHVLIPGAFKQTDPGYTANVSLFLLSLVNLALVCLATNMELQIYSNFNSYTVPGPAPVSPYPFSKKLCS